MFRSLIAGVLAAGIALTAGLPGTPAQEKAQPKKKERIAIADPKDAAKDPDFAIQGEYEGEVKTGEESVKFGIDLIAMGGGKFAVASYRGGLPGAGWNGKGPKYATAERTGDNKATIKESNGDVIAEVADGAITVKGKASGTLKKVGRKSKTLGEKPPAGAVVLFGAEGDEKNWNNGRLLELSDGKFLTVARVKKPDGKEQGGSIVSKEKFGALRGFGFLRQLFLPGSIKIQERLGAFKAHVEFRLPWMPNSTGQGRGNSGVYLQDRYECQVLDSFGLSGENNECGGIYTQHKPLVNMCLPPMAWQTYDIEFTPAVFEGDKKVKNGRATIYHNGVKIHDDIEFPKECPGGQKEAELPGPFQFQDHGDPVVYRNVWVVPVK